MEELRGHKNTVPLMSLTFGENGNDVSHSPEDDLHQQYIMAARRNKTHPVPLPLPQWIHCQQTSHHYVKFLTGSGVSDIQREREVSHNLGMVPIFKPAELSLDMDARKVEPYAKMLNSSHQEASINLAGTLCSGQIEIKDGERCSVPMVRYLRSHNEGRPVNNFTSAEYQTRLQKQESNEDYCNVSQPHSRVAVAAPGFPPKPRKNVARQRATDRRRRLRIAEKLDTLQELLPHSKEGGKASVLDDVIDHIKHLQLQIKDLSRSRLEGESTSDPFICLEGYGHYLLHEQMLSEPLEEVVGKLLEMNPSAATQLLESRGLFMMPATLAEGLHQTI
uniref:Putative transcription factor bHLH69-like isoform X2 n=1 Tax=Davidia involucrata TaxID=16924 RepID=A0A5B6ZHX9_DAVIN